MYEEFKADAQRRINSYKTNEEAKAFKIEFIKEIVKLWWWKNWLCLGVPIYQAPMDLAGFAEIIWNVKPDLIIETGIKYGGSLLWNLSQLILLEACGLVKNPRVVGIDTKMPRDLAQHPLANRVTMIKGSSTSPAVIAKVKQIARRKKRVLVILDSLHSHKHVLEELKLYSPLVTKGSYIIVEDTGVQDLVEWKKTHRSKWSIGDNPRTAVWEFMKGNKEFVIDSDIEYKVFFTAYPDGYLKRIK
jgi:cephalosporin hydroxylase